MSGKCYNVCMFWSILFLSVGFLLLLKSADFFVDGAAGLANQFGIPRIVVGLTLVAFGTSAPEITVTLIAALQNSADLSVGNIIGSNIANIGLILGTAAIFRVLTVPFSTITRGIPLNILSVVVLIVLGFDTFFQNHSVGFNRFTIGDGVIFLCFFAVFIYYIYGDLKIARIQEESIQNKEKVFRKEPLYRLLIMIFGGCAGLMAGGKMVVDNAINIATVLHVSEAFIGVTIVAVGTSLPELGTSVVAALKKENDLAVGNIIGSNIFNIFLALGVGSVFSVMEFSPKLLLDAVFLLLLTVLLFLFVVKGKGLDRTKGIVLVSAYVLYIVLSVVREIGLIG